MASNAPNNNSGTQDFNGMVELASTVNTANQAMNSVSAQIPQGTKDYLNNAKKQILDSDKLRSFSVFFGIGEKEDSYSFPLKPNILFPRLKENILFFYLNYILLAAVIFVISALAVLISPKTLILVGCLLIAWLLMIRATQGGSLKIGSGGMEISRKTASMILLVISGLVIFFLVKSLFFVTLGSASFFSLLHAWTRNASVHIGESSAKEEAFVQMS